MTIRRVSPSEAHALVEQEGYAYLDVRAVPEFDTGHPPGAYNVPLRTPRAGGGMDDNEQFVAQVRAAFSGSHAEPRASTPTARKLVVGCATGVRSLRASELLLAAGFDDVVDQRAGIDGVRDAFGRVREPGHRALGLPLTQQVEPGRSHAEIRALAEARALARE